MQALNQNIDEKHKIKHSFAIDKTVFLYYNLFIYIFLKSELNMTTKKRNKKSTIISLAVMMLIIGLTLYMIFTKYSPSALLEVLKETNPLFILAAVALMLIYVSLEGVSLHTITHSLGEKTGYGKGLIYASVDLYFSALTPSSEGGQPLMIYTMARDGISIPRSTITAVLFTNMFTSGLLICTGIAFIISPSLIAIDNIWFRICLMIGLAISIIIFIGCILLLRFGHTMKKLGVKLIGFLHKIHILKNTDKALHKLDDAVNDFAACSEYIKTHPFLTIKVLLYATLQRIVFFSVPYFIYLAFGLSGATYFEIFAIQVVTQMAVYALPIPGSAGATEYMMLLLYQTVYPESYAASAMLLARAVTFYFTVIFCGSVTLGDSIHFRRKKREETSKS